MRGKAESVVPGAGDRQGDVADQANSDTEAELQIRLHQTDDRLLCAIEEALVRVKQGAHGVCVTYGLAISMVRLNAVAGRTTAANVRSSRGPDTQERAGHESRRSG
jgi:RNA polymerase-binding transcription factor DksA